MKKKLTEHYIRWSVLYGIAGFIVCAGTVCGADSLIENINALTHNHDGASLLLLLLYALIVFLPSFLAAVYAVYVIFFAVRPQRGLKGLKFKFKKTGQNGTNCIVE